jgi:hypothetical protein
MDKDAKLLKEAYNKVDEARMSAVERENNPFEYWWQGYIQRQNLKGHPELKLLKQVAADGWIGSSVSFRPHWG